MGRRPHQGRCHNYRMDFEPPRAPVHPPDGALPRGFGSLPERRRPEPVEPFPSLARWFYLASLGAAGASVVVVLALLFS